jgi:hypothetical protein
MTGSLNRVKEVVSKIRHIEIEAKEKGDKANKYLTDRCNTIANDENKRLNVLIDKKTGELLSKPVCSYRYYAQLMENYRSGIKALNLKHHAISLNISRFVKKYKSKKPELNTMLDENLTIEKLRENVILLRSDTVTGSEYRSDLLSLKIEHHAFYLFEPKGTIKDFISDDNKKQLNKKLHNQILVNAEWVKKITNELLKSPDSSVAELVVGVALATGRRLTEVMKTAKFKINGDLSLIFSGQLKTKNRHLFEDITGYEIPSLVNTKLVTDALKNIRKRTGKDQLNYNNVLGDTITSTVEAGDYNDYYHNKAVHKKYESTVNRTVRMILQNGNFSLKDCRALYTETTYNEHANAGESRSAYRHRVLGHSLIETQLHYDAFQIDNTVETIKLVIKKENNGNNEDIQQALHDYLTTADNKINDYVRAPKIAIMHTWLKGEIKNGLEFNVITASYVRRHCLIDGKQLNLNTIKTYLSEKFINLAEFKPPKVESKKPKTKLEKDIAEIELTIFDNQERCETITNKREELDDEHAELKEQLFNNELENEELELEHESLDGEIEELQQRLIELKAKLPSTDKTENKTTWPGVDEIKIKAEKTGKEWRISSLVNGTEFEVMAAGNKTGAITAFKSYYLKQTKM